MSFTYQPMETCLPCWRAGEGPNRHCNTCPCCTPCHPHQVTSCLICYPRVTIEFSPKRR